jgi:DNA-binding NarL/FixJ family response regulator
MNKINLGIFDDHPMVVEGVTNAIKADYSHVIKVVFAASTKNDLHNNIALFSPMIMMLDIVADDVTGLELFQEFKDKYPRIFVIAYSSLSSPVLVENLLYLGVKGYVNKRQTKDELIQTILKVAEGNIVVPDDYKYLTSKYNNTQSSSNSMLSDREIEIVNYIGKEFTSQEIADKLDLALSTIENHRKRIFYKLGVKNVAGMIMEASKLGYLK